MADQPVTLYEQYQREQAVAAAVRDLWAPPLSEAVRHVSTTRPTLRSGQCAIRVKGTPVLTPAFLKPRWIEAERPSKDRGS